MCVSFGTTGSYTLYISDVSIPSAAFLTLKLSGPIWKCAPVPPVFFNVAASVSSLMLNPFCESHFYMASLFFIRAYMESNVSPSNGTISYAMECPCAFFLLWFDLLPALPTLWSLNPLDILIYLSSPYSFNIVERSFVV